MTARGFLPLLRGPACLAFPAVLPVPQQCSGVSCLGGRARRTGGWGGGQSCPVVSARCQGWILRSASYKISLVSREFTGASRIFTGGKQSGPALHWTQWTPLDSVDTAGQSGHGWTVSGGLGTVLPIDTPPAARLLRRSDQKTSLAVKL